MGRLKVGLSDPDGLLLHGSPHKALRIEEQDLFENQLRVSYTRSVCRASRLVLARHPLTMVEGIRFVLITRQRNNSVNVSQDRKTGDAKPVDRSSCVGHEILQAGDAAFKKRRGVALAVLKI